jgi:hypothetical protein
MRGILIDPVAKTVTEVKHDGSLRDTYRLTDCTCICSVNTGHGRDVLFLDDEGLYREDQVYFHAKFYPHQPLAGKALWVGISEAGDTKSTTVALDKARAAITFPDVQPQFSHQDTSVREEPGWTIISSQARFK